MYSKLSSIVVDDETGALDTAQNMLNKYCPELSIDGLFDNPEDALLALSELKPSIVLLDYQMPEMNAFQFLQACPQRQWEVIVITGYQETAAKFYDYDVAHFLVKPYSGEKLKEAVERCKRRLLNRSLVDERTLAANMRDKTLFFRYDEILYLKAEGAYTRIVAKNNRSAFVGKGVGKFAQELLHQDSPFFQIHEAYIVSRYAIRGITATSVLLNHGDQELPLARRRKSVFLRWWGSSDLD